MDGKLTYGVSLVLGVLAFILLIANVALINSNRHQQESANARQVEINKGASLASLNQSLIQALAEAATTKNDAEARGLLAAQGITIRSSDATKPADTKSSK